MGEKLSGWVLPSMFIVAWVLSLLGVSAPGIYESGFSLPNTISWLLFFAGWVFLASSVMHSVFAKKMAKSIGWKTNGFQYEIAAVSLGLGIGALLSSYSGLGAEFISIPIITFLFFAGVNHLIEIIKKKNYAPNNTLILIWDFGVSISLLVLVLMQYGGGLSLF